jgi:hypothetical protein
MQLRVGLLHLLAVAWTSTQLVAQSAVPERPLPVAGTLSYNALFMSHPSDWDRGNFGARFAGRFAVRTGGRTYVGMAVGSWAQASLGRCSAPIDCGTYADYWSEAIVYQIFGQHTPLAGFPGWVRLGAGFANTSTLAPAGTVITVADRWRAAVSAGAGSDVRVAEHVFVTPSVDYTVLPAVERDQLELRHALALGVGVTIR